MKTDGTSGILSFWRTIGAVGSDPRGSTSDETRLLEQRHSRIAKRLLLFAGIAFVAMNYVLVHRMTNAHFGDIEFTGWSGPMGSRLLRGDRPYVDFVLPIPPGSFAVLALIEAVCGRALVVQELALNAVIHVAMGVLAYFMARAVTSPKNALFTAVATWVTVIQLNKECAYDHTAQFVAWCSTAAGLWALFTPRDDRRSRYWLWTGVFAGLTLAFKQSTALGCVGGWLVALAYLAAMDYRAPGTLPGDVETTGAERARAWLGPLGHYLRGVAAGIAGVWLLLLLLGSTARAFFQAAFVDASTLKGGFKLLFENFAIYLLEFPAYPASFFYIAVCVLVGHRLFRRRGTLRIGDEPGRDSIFHRWEIAVVTLLTVGGFGALTLYLVKGPPGYSMDYILDIDRLKQLPGFGLVTLSAVFVAHTIPANGGDATTGERDEERPREAVPLRSDPVRAGHAFNAVLLAAFACSLMHNTSAPEFRPFYDNNAIVPLAFLTLFVLLDRADLRWLGALMLALFVASITGNKYFRAMTSKTAIGEGYWAGMQINGHAQQIYDAAKRVRELTGPNDTVLVLPEDLQIESLIDRPRPPLTGAIVFVDQYAPRLAKDDIARLDENPPKVIVIHPHDVSMWQRFYRIWSGESGAEQVLQHVLRSLIPSAYKKDSSIPTTFLYEPAMLDIYVLRDRPLEPGEEPENPLEDSDNATVLEAPERPARPKPRGDGPVAPGDE